MWSPGKDEACGGGGTRSHGFNVFNNGFNETPAGFNMWSHGKDETYGG